MIGKFVELRPHFFLFIQNYDLLKYCTIYPKNVFRPKSPQKRTSGLSSASAQILDVLQSLIPVPRFTIPHPCSCLCRKPPIVCWKIYMQWSRSQPKFHGSFPRKQQPWTMTTTCRYLVPFLRRTTRFSSSKKVISTTSRALRRLVSNTSEIERVINLKAMFKFQYCIFF